MNPYEVIAILKKGRFWKGRHKCCFETIITEQFSGNVLDVDDIFIFLKFVEERFKIEQNSKFWEDNK